MTPFPGLTPFPSCHGRCRPTSVSQQPTEAEGMHDPTTRGSVRRPPHTQLRAHRLLCTLPIVKHHVWNLKIFAMRSLVELLCLLQGCVPSVQLSHQPRVKVTCTRTRITTPWLLGHRVCTAKREASLAINHHPLHLNMTLTITRPQTPRQAAPREHCK